MEKIRMGFVGMGARGMGNQRCVLTMPDVEVTAVCDLYPDRAELAADENEAVYGRRPFTTTDYKELIKRDDVDAVIITSAWESHIPIAIDAMKAGKAVAMEVGGAYSVYDCHELVRVQEETGAPFMFLENCCFDQIELTATALARRGVFGEIVHCSGAYGHDLRKQIAFGEENRHYRLRNYTHRNCDNYPTHELGPIAKLLGINRGNRMVSLVSVASKSAGVKAYIDAHKDEVNPKLHGKDFMQGDVVTTIITCAHGQTIQLRLDTCLPRRYDREFTVHGTKAYSCNTELKLTDEDRSVIHSFNDLTHILPSCWTDMTDEGRALGHGGMDGIEFRVFVDCLKNGKPMPVDVYDAASWMCISCLSEASVAQGGMPQAIPDFTHGQWVIRPLEDVVEFPDVELGEIK